MELYKIENDVNKREEESKNAPAFFFTMMCYSEAKSKEKGRPIFEPKTYLQVDTGDEGMRDIKILPADDQNKKIYSAQWKFFQNMIAPIIKTGVKDDFSVQQLAEEYPEVFESYKATLRDADLEGTLIEESGLFPMSQVMSLKYYGYFTVEQLASEPEATDIITIDMIAKSKNYIESKKYDGNILKLIELVQELTKKLRDKK